MSHEFEEGDRVRDTRTNREGILTEINPNPDYEPDGECWAELEHPVTQEYVDLVERPEDLELVTKKADLPEKRLPSLEELRNYVSSSLHGGWSEGISAIETGPDGEDAVEFYGQMDNQRFSARIKIDYISWAD